MAEVVNAKQLLTAVVKIYRAKLCANDQASQGGAYLSRRPNCVRNIPRGQRSLGLFDVRLKSYLQTITGWVT